MPNYRVGFSTGAWSSVVVTADNPEDALEKADEVFYEIKPDICAQCSGMFDEKRHPGLELGEDWEYDGEDPTETDDPPTETD